MFSLSLANVAHLEISGIIVVVVVVVAVAAVVVVVFVVVVVVVAVVAVVAAAADSSHFAYSLQEVCAFLGDARTGTVSVTRSGDRPYDLRRGALSSAALLSGGRNGKSGIGGGIGGVRRDIDRIFESSVAGSGEICCRCCCFCLICLFPSSVPPPRREVQWMFSSLFACVALGYPGTKIEFLETERTLIPCSQMYQSIDRVS